MPSVSQTQPLQVVDPATVPAACAQCGDAAAPRRGRCRRCGAVRSVATVWRHERRAAVLAIIGDEWLDWVGEIAFVVVVVLVIVGALPAWTLALAALTLVRPASRLLAALASGALSS